MRSMYWMYGMTSSIVAVCAIGLAGCGDGGEAAPPGGEYGHAHTPGESHAHGEGSAKEHGHEHDNDYDHDHDEAPLGTTMIGEWEVECWQAHGDAAPGKELHLVVKLPFNDNGATIVRAWIGTEDRLASMVSRGDYAASHDDYDIHAEAPDPLPAGSRWWIELERPDGRKAVGSIGLK